jgi:hypothetical protein
VRRIAWFVPFAALLRAQDDVDIPDDWYPWAPPPQLFLAVIGFALYGYWRLAKWFIRHRRNNSKWEALRHWWPTSMVGIAAPAILLNSTYSHSGVSASDFVAAAAIVLNLPAAPIAFLVVRILGDWAVLLVGLPSLWLTWYGIIRFLEWRSECGAPLSISIDPTSSQPPQS